MMDNPFDSEEWAAYAELALKELVPMVRDSAFTITMVPQGKPDDVKIATELGFMVWLDKPIIAVVPPGARVPAKLIAVADEIVEGPAGKIDADATFIERLGDAIMRLRAKTGISSPE